MQREQSEVSPEGDMAVSVPCIYFRHINKVVLDYSISLGGCRWTPGEGDAVRVAGKSIQAKWSGGGCCNSIHIILA